jgi:hypothetical protein
LQTPSLELRKNEITASSLLGSTKKKKSHRRWKAFAYAENVRAPSIRWVFVVLLSP